MKMLRIVCPVFIVLLTVSVSADTIPLTINPATVLNTIDEKIYGQFLESINNSVHGGLWGEMLLNRTFEADASGWSIVNNELVGTSNATPNLAIFGSTGWTDYEFTLEAQKTGGAEGFLILFRVNNNDQDYYWYNIGGWGNTQNGIEKTYGGGKTALGSRTNFTVTANIWYTIRVRCQAGRFQIWINSTLLTDATDASPMLSGRVGVGTWSTQAKFRNFRVTTLDGSTVLFSGMPPSIIVKPATYWTFYDSTGTASFGYDNAVKVNGSCSQTIQLTSATAEAGVQQEPLCIKPGETYKGSVFLRADVGQTCRVAIRLINQASGATIWSQTVDVTGPQYWHQQVSDPLVTADNYIVHFNKWKIDSSYKFQYGPAAAAVDNAVFRIGLVGSGKVWIDQVKLMAQGSIDNNGFRKDLFDAIGDLRPQTLRWPGGAFAAAYIWKDAIGPEDRRLLAPPAWGDQDMNFCGIDEIIKMCRSHGTELNLVLNTTAGLQNSLDWMEYVNGSPTTGWGKVRAANGHTAPYGIKFWEVDNETWFFYSPATYITVINNFIPAMRSKMAALNLQLVTDGYAADTISAANLKIGVCGCYAYNTGDGQSGYTDYLTPFINNNTRFDFISLHYYNGLLETLDYTNDPPRYEQFINTIPAKFAASTANKNAKVYVSEWNPMCNDWRNGLYAGGILNGFERSGSVCQMSCPALFLRSVTAGSWDNALVNFDHKTWYPAPNYVIMKLYHDNFAPNRVQLTGTPGTLNILATKSADNNTVIVKAVNPVNLTRTVNLTVNSSFTVQGATAYLVDAGGNLNANNTLATPHAIWPQPATVRRIGQQVSIDLPRYTVAVVKITNFIPTGTKGAVQQIPREQKVFTLTIKPDGTAAVAASSGCAQGVLSVYSLGGRLIAQSPFDGKRIDGRISLRGSVYLYSLKDLSGTVQSTGRVTGLR